MINILLGLISLILPLFSYSAEYNPWNEHYYNKKWCNSIGGHSGYYIQSADKQVDCLTDNFAIETDWATNKTYEGIGQSLVYARLTNKIPGLLLLIKNPDDLIWVQLAKDTYKHHRINAPVWYIYAHERMNE